MSMHFAEAKSYLRPTDNVFHKKKKFKKFKKINITGPAHNAEPTSCQNKNVRPNNPVQVKLHMHARRAEHVRTNMQASVWLLWYLHLAHWAFSSRGILASLLESFGSPIWPHRPGVYWVVTRGESRRKSRGCETMHSWAQFPVRGMTDIAVGRGCVLVGCGVALCRVPETIVQCARV